MTRESIITCPHRGTAKNEAMPDTACQIRYVCTGCGRVLQPKPGAVACSAPTASCPALRSKQSGLVNPTGDAVIYVL